MPRYLDQNSISTSLPNISFKISTPTRSSASTSATLTTSRIFYLASSKARVTSFKTIKQQWASEFVTDKGRRWSDSLGSDKNTQYSLCLCPNFNILLDVLFWGMLFWRNFVATYSVFSTAVVIWWERPAEFWSSHSDDLRHKNKRGNVLNKNKQHML